MKPTWPKQCGACHRSLTAGDASLFTRGDEPPVLVCPECGAEHRPLTPPLMPGDKVTVRGSEHTVVSFPRGSPQDGGGASPVVPPGMCKGGCGEAAYVDHRGEVDSTCGRYRCIDKVRNAILHPPMPLSGPLDAIQIITVDRDVWKRRATEAERRCEATTKELVALDNRVVEAEDPKDLYDDVRATIAKLRAT